MAALRAFEIRGRDLQQKGGFAQFKNSREVTTRLRVAKERRRGPWHRVRATAVR